MRWMVMALGVTLVAPPAFGHGARSGEGPRASNRAATHKSPPKTSRPSAKRRAPKRSVKKGSPRADADTWSFSFGRRARLGVSLTRMSKELRKFFGAGEDSGVLVDRVESGSAAAKAGVRVGDVVTSVDGKQVKTSLDVTSALRGKKKGDRVSLEVVRNKRKKRLVAVVDREADDGFSFDFSLELPKDLPNGEWHRHFEKKFEWKFPDEPWPKERRKRFEKRMKRLEKELERMRKRVRERTRGTSA